MKKQIALVVACASLLFFAAPGLRAQASGQTSGQVSEQPLTNASVVKFVRARFSEKTIITIIRSRPSRFDLSPDRLIDLKKNGVSEKIILAMLTHETERVVASEEWGDEEELFKEGIKSDGGPAHRSSDPNEVNIFGNSGGSRGSVRSRGLNGASEGETQTMGSASVRILRPPAESGGGAAPKLERTPTLTNESVVELVEAGFTEGTIIRRIEQSPADFDLSNQKLAELRKRRVTEPVIAAMRAAMSGDDANQRPEN